MRPERRGHNADGLKRRNSERKSYDRVLIVCEGERTEPSYFLELCDHYSLSTANIKVIPGDGNDPVSIVRTAKDLQRIEKRQGERYDRIYCVFDRDEHTNYVDACRQAGQEKFHTARSNPAFEYWLLLHFEDTRAPYQRSGKRTAAQNCERSIKRHLPKYSKGMRGLFQELLGRLPEAKARSVRVLADARQTGDWNPSTEVHELVDYLQKLKG